MSPTPTNPHKTPHTPRRPCPGRPSHEPSNPSTSDEARRTRRREAAARGMGGRPVHGRTATGLYTPALFILSRKGDSDD